MTILRTLAPGKVNLSLFVGRPRADGLHALVSVVQPVTVADELTLSPSEGGQDEVVCPGVDGENLAAVALASFRERTGWDGPPVRLEIEKRVPVAAGMGGGSGDAAAALRLLRAASGLPLPPGLAMSLGADVPAMLHPGRVLMTGAGEHVAAVPPGPPERAFVLVPLDAALPTPAVYRAFDELGLGRDPEELAELDRTVRADPELLGNDLEAAALHLCPPVGPALDAVRDAGARIAMVSGSGPTVFGVFDHGARAEHAAAHLRAHGYPRAVAAAPARADHAAVREG